MVKISKAERLIVFLLMGVQFTHVVDFVVLMPLGPQLMRTMALSPSQFAFLVSSYAFAAALAGILTSFFADRFDRKRLLMVSYVGFLFGTLLCASAQSYFVLGLGRFLAGAFGGSSFVTCFSITGDVIPESRRGWAMGLLMSSFSIASVIGVPIGVAASNHWDWHMPFWIVTVFGMLVAVIVGVRLTPVRGHLNQQRLAQGLVRSAPLFQKRFRAPAFLKAFLLSFLLNLSSFLVIPFISPYMVRNVGLKETELPLIYFFGGLCTFFSSQWVGRLSDRFGKPRVFRIGAMVSLIPLLLVTHLPHAPVWAAVICSTCFMVSMNARFVPATAMITSVPNAEDRGGFMSLNSFVQHVASGVAPLISGWMIGESDPSSIEQVLSGVLPPLEHYGWVGVISVGVSLVAIMLVRGKGFEPVSHPVP